MKKAVFLDRDGVLNRAFLSHGIPKPPMAVEDIQILDGVVEAIQILKSHNFLPIVISNQPDVARGTTTQSQVEAINAHIGSMTDIADFYTCFHDDSDRCDCRKPSPGLINRASHDLGLDPTKSFLVGDRWRDITAGQRAGCASFYIDYAYGEEAPNLPFIKVSSLLQATHIITGGLNASE
jgi:D-glycero-D-manno-heptose 1,7-bisphosphate phosphatase